ncbi:MAG: FGGY family carbohydrate kinase [Candidatus Melainabacteria bacterium]|nr:FGGY family carbohydrate kinase [Candidatus Melainabacteria bacterium]
MSKKKYFLAIDQGTSSSRAILYDSNLNEITKSQIEFKQYYPHKDWVEHDPEEIYASELQAIQVVLNNLKKILENEIHDKALNNALNIEIPEIYTGITNQRETVIIWDRKTSKPVYPAIVWQDSRTVQYCTQLKNTAVRNVAALHEAGENAEIRFPLHAQNISELIQHKTGLVIDTYFSASKIKWILDSDPEIRARAEAGELACGTVDTWLLWKLSNGTVHRTDYTNASRTMLFNINTLSWDEELLGIFNIPECLMAEALPSQANYLDFDLEGFNIKVKAVAGDQSASLFGHGCFKPNQAKCTFGTGAFFLLNIGEDSANVDQAKGTVAKRTSSRLRRTNDRSVLRVHEDHEDDENAEIGVRQQYPKGNKENGFPEQSPKLGEKNKLLKTIAFALADGSVHYALEGSIFIAGSGLNWLKNSLGFFESAAETEAMARSVSEEDMAGLYLVPAFTGLGAPYWDMNARAAVLGMSLDTGKTHLVRAMLEAVAYQVKDLISSINLKEMAAQQDDANAGNGVVQRSLKEFILNVDGGLAVNNFLMEFMAGILGVKVNRNENLELTALGIVMMVANALGDYDLEELLSIHESRSEAFTEAYLHKKIARLYSGWQRAVASVRNFSGGL